MIPWVPGSAYGGPGMTETRELFSMAAYDLIAVYLMASRRNGTLYLGVTSDLLQRGLEHREGRVPGFSQRYSCKILVWWEQHSDMPSAIMREKHIKKWRRAWKLTLIENANPRWRDLYEDFLLPPSLKRMQDEQSFRGVAARDEPGTQGAQSAPQPQARNAQKA